MNALEFNAQVRDDLLPENGNHTRLVDADRHDAWLLGILADPKFSRITIVSPWVVVRTIEQAGILTAIRNAVGEGKEIIVYLDPALNGHSGSDRPSNLDLAEEAFANIGVELKKVRQIHSKIVMVDDLLLCSGSFNWLSAAREGEFVRHELSYVYEGQNTENEIRFLTDAMSQRLVDTA